MNQFPYTGGYLRSRLLGWVTAQERHSVIMEPNIGLIDSTRKILKIGVRVWVVRLVAPVQMQDTPIPLAMLSEPMPLFIKILVRKSVVRMKMRTSPLKPVL
jgi:hypothetical protein